MMRHALTRLTRLCPGLPGLCALALAALAGAAAPAQGQSVIRNAELSARLFEAAEELRDPMLAVAAARLRKSVLAMQIVRTPSRQGPAPVGVVPQTRLLSWQQMLARALEMSDGNETIARLADDVRFAGTKGVASGQVYSISTIAGSGRDSYPPLEYVGGDYAEVYVEAQHKDADLNLFVRDAQGRLVCSDTDVSAIAYCGWRPARSEFFTVEVENRGTVASSYSLITN
ncbi:hypothetical protein SAMN06297129_2911 [Pseudooceanicola antarcticus]|uniref:Uncharacterized protein n=1 Tax=Pseudooceanicola antarcticus TaxID=1247613 RepID=A0A285J396_9RHOB|nr:hypothetical protein [Pseudooceanicola antarcticus]PJE29697.1 hypothetical protein CVM39_07255 [Pseudooceanicola antarcticus]SNY54795.1 hypothetical protein SAMN06297129_2911 [Pseudooceanicola antarcticus]